jgi:hypothetical protein
MASWSPGNAPAKFASHFATEEDRLIAKVAEGGSWALWMGVFNKAWLQLLKSYGMNHNACMKLTRDICRTITKYRIELHNVRFKPEKARRAAEKVKNREALGDYIRKWYSTISHERVEFSQYEMLTWKMRRKDKWVRAHKNKARKAAEQAQMVRALGSSTLHRRLRRTKEHMRKMVAHKCSHSTQYTLTQMMQQNADKAMGREPHNCSPKPTQKLQRHADKIMGRESPETGTNNQSFEPPVASTTGQKKRKMNKKSSGSRGNRTPTTGITDRVLPHERGCRGICPDLGEPLLEEANHSFKPRADKTANLMRQPANKRKSRSIIIDDEPDINIAVSVDAPATAVIDGVIAAPTSAARAAAPSTASKRIKLPDTNKRKTACLELTDVLQVKIGRHNGAAHISSRIKAAHNKTVKEAMELHVASRGGNKRKYALTDIKADIANKRLFVRKGLPPTGGSPPPHPSHQGGDHPPHPHPDPNTNGKHNTAKPATAAAPTAPTAPTATTTLLGRWLKTAEVRDREMKPD